MKRVFLDRPLVASESEAVQAFTEDAYRVATPPTTVEIGAQLSRILGTPEFAASTRSARVLTYIVERTLAGEARLLKQYSIATAALGRNSGFDPDSDPLVRQLLGPVQYSRTTRALIHGRSLSKSSALIP